jgi:hypothetical protein
MKTVTSFKECHPFYRDRAKTAKYFPMGYVIFPHDTGDRFTPKNKIFPDWEQGTVQKMVDDGMYWFNMFYVIGIDNYAAWKRPQERASTYWTTTETYKRFLDFLEEKRIETGGKFDAKGILKITSRDDNGNIYSTGTWDGIPGNNLETYINRVKLLGRHDRLLGWAISDEPYMGDGARKMGIRNRNMQQLQYLKQIVLENDPRINEHFTYLVERPDGNYGYDFVSDPSKKYLLEGLTGVCDYFIDNIYSYDYRLSAQYSPDKDPYNWVINRPKYILDNLINRVHGVDLGSQKASFVLSSGMIYKDCPFPDGGVNIPEELLRFQNYHFWINSILGGCFWMLSKSDADSYNKVKNVSFEGFKASEYLMNPANSVSDKFTLNVGDNDDVEFVARQHPVLKNKMLIMLANLGVNKVNLASIHVDNTVKINEIVPIVSSYSSWKTQVSQQSMAFSNIFSRTARAFILDFDVVTGA